jgi:hypothetical protein
MRTVEEGRRFASPGSASQNSLNRKISSVNTGVPNHRNQSQPLYRARYGIHDQSRRRADRSRTPEFHTGPEPSTCLRRISPYARVTN